MPICFEIKINLDFITVTPETAAFGDVRGAHDPATVLAVGAALDKVITRLRSELMANSPAK